jgi:uncharacterized protein (TIGR03437 family)
MVLLAALALGPLADSSSTAPVYSADSIVNSASGVAGFFAPNTFISIYGQNLSRVTRAITSDDIRSGILPTALGSTGVRVLVNQIPADLWYVSPTLVNLLVPTLLIAGPATLQLESDGVAGPPVSITLGALAPALWQLDATTVLAVHLDGSVVSAGSPAKGGEVIVLFATGMGPTVPAQIPNQVANSAAQIAAKSDFTVVLNGTGVDTSKILYAGAAPGTAGVYQINLMLPENVPKNPEIRIGTSDRMSAAARMLPLQ